MIAQKLRIAARYIFAGVLAASTFAFAQDPSIPPPPPADSQPVPAPNSGWRRVGDPAAQQPSSPTDPNQAASQSTNPAPPPQNYPQNYPPPPNASYGQNGQPNYAPNSAQQQPAYQPPPIPEQLTIPAGTFITVRVNQALSSDHNQAGDAFSATLVQPVVVNGVVVAEPGQTVGGRVTQAEKAGHVEGVAKLGVQITQLTLVDGQQLPLQSSLVFRKGPTSVGQDAGTIAGTTALGAAVGAAADWGRGAAIGAGAGAAAGIIGVLVTRGHPSVIYPESVLTFRLEAPLTISTARAPQAFRYVQPGEYDRPSAQPAPYAGTGPYAAAPPPPYYAYPYAYAAPYPYYYGYPYYWGPSFSLFVGRGYGWGGPYYYGRGYYGHRR